MKRIEVISLDRIGLVGEISNVIRRLNGNIITHTANVVTDEQNTLVSHFTADICFETASEDEAVSRRLRRIKNVRQVRITDI
ncbi:ACT domain-containing protein [Ruminococcus flavefaciens]|uniref:ACT domain-containing protein n=1 Tax=Ruminococcus flavefaciens TaxID=1265 RepID=UPI00048CBAB9|nr:ACT domain-containing protein [Ruminococcus flavefaciens]